MLEEYLKVVVLFLKSGDHIQTPFMTINPTVAVSNGKETCGEVYSDNFPKKLTVTVPASLAKGNYIIKTRTMINEKLYTTEYEGILKVQ